MEKLFRLWGSPIIDLFATRLNRKLPVYCSPVPDPMAALEDAFQHPWDGLDAYAFPPFALIRRVINRVLTSQTCRMTLIAPLRPQCEWLPDLLGLLVERPVKLPTWDRLLRQPHVATFHNSVQTLNLHAWRLSSVPSEIRAFRDGLRRRWLDASVSPPQPCISLGGHPSLVGVVDGVALLSRPMFP